MVRREFENPALLNLGSHKERSHHGVPMQEGRHVFSGPLHEGRFSPKDRQVDIGDVYSISGTGDTPLIHGINDGLHGSKVFANTPLRNDIRVILERKLLQLV